MTPVNLIRLILRTATINGVGQTPNAEDNNDMLLQLNIMLDEWSAQRFLVYHLIDVSTPVTGAASYTVGTGGAFNTPRPDQIESAYYLRTDINPNARYILTPIQSREDWNKIVVPGINAWPSSYFYDTAYPLGVFWPYPYPQAGNGELHISVKDQLTEFADLTTDIALPKPYLNALLWCGAQRARVMYGLESDPGTDRMARAALSVLRAVNVQLPRLVMPAIVIGQGRRYNVFSNSFR